LYSVACRTKDILNPGATCSLYCGIVAEQPPVQTATATACNMPYRSKKAFKG